MEINYTKLIIAHVISLDDDQLKKFYNKMIKPKKLKIKQIKDLTINLPKNVILNKVFDINMVDNIFSFIKNIRKKPESLYNISDECYEQNDKLFNELVKDEIACRKINIIMEDKRNKLNIYPSEYEGDTRMIIDICFFVQISDTDSMFDEGGYKEYVFSELNKLRKYQIPMCYIYEGKYSEMIGKSIISNIDGFNIKFNDKPYIFKVKKLKHIKVLYTFNKKISKLPEYHPDNDF